ncbi:MAG TPA: class I SAM-dependent methyltransferase [Kofleriaceae bacterium]|nr:class I SAM-dependent methyltransferase [Kofleriaceae bacterium]
MSDAPPTLPPPGPLQLPATWDAVAAGYAEEVPRWFGAFALEAERAADLRPADRVLDVAAGPGTLAFQVAPRVARVTATDFSPSMIEELRARAAREGVANVEGQVMDAQALGFPDGSFDAAFCMFAFMFFPDRARAFRELHRVLAPGGRAVVGTWAPIERRPLMKVGFDAIAEVFPDLPRPQKGDLQQPEECVAEMTAAGFREVSARAFGASVWVESAERYLDVMERSGAPLAILRKKLPPAAWAEAHGRLVDVVRRSVPSGGVELAAEAIITRGDR